MEKLSGSYDFIRNSNLEVLAQYARNNDYFIDLLYIRKINNASRGAFVVNVFDEYGVAIFGKFYDATSTNIRLFEKDIEQVCKDNELPALPVEDYKRMADLLMKEFGWKEEPSIETLTKKLYYPNSESVNMDTQFYYVDEYMNEFHIYEDGDMMQVVYNAGSSPSTGVGSTITIPFYALWDGDDGEENLNQNTLKLILAHFHTYKKYFESESNKETFNG